MKRMRMAGIAALFALAPTEGEAQTKIAVVSDVHIMNPALLKQDGEAFAEYIRNDRKMLKLGPSLLDNATERILKDKPQVVLVTGDLTKDGDKTTRVATPKADEFAKIYADYGYGDALARDPYSLSYVQQLDKNTRIICLDACEYYDNDIRKNISWKWSYIFSHIVKYLWNDEAPEDNNAKLLNVR